MESRNSAKYLAVITGMGNAPISTWMSAIVLVLLMTRFNQLSAQSLSEVRIGVRAPSLPDNDSSDNDRRRNRRDDDDDDDGDNNFVGELISTMLFGGGTVRTQASSSSDSGSDIDYEIYSEASGNEGQSISFLDFPYADEKWGSIQVGATQGSSSRLTAATWYSTDFDDIDSWNAHFVLDNPGPVGLDFQWSHLTEKLTGAPRDSLNLADLNLTYRWIESPELISRIGGGINLLSDRFGTEVDYNFTLSSDFFPAKPWIIHLELDHGEIGSVHQTHLLSTVGVNYRRIEYLIGYEYRRIGQVNIDGPLMGIKFWW